MVLRLQKHLTVTVFGLAFTPVQIGYSSNTDSQGPVRRNLLDHLTLFIKQMPSN